MASAVLICRAEETALDSLADIRALKKLGMDIAAMTRMMRTTIKSSIKENPRCPFLPAAFANFPFLSENIFWGTINPPMSTTSGSFATLILRMTALALASRNHFRARQWSVLKAMLQKKGEAELPPMERTNQTR